MRKGIIDALLNPIAPIRCVGCNKFGRYFCRQCLADIRIIDRQKCPVCERPAVGGETHPRCNGKYALNGLFSLFEYRGIIRQALKHLKYRQLTDIQDELARIISYVLTQVYDTESLFELESFINYQNTTIIPIPLHWWRKQERGFNQANLIAHIFAREYLLPVVPNLLVRTRNTTPQSKLRGEERLNNVKSIFRVRKRFLAQKNKQTGKQIKSRVDTRWENLLLVDDLTTTGATLSSAANTLKRAGVKTVWALTLAA